MKGKPLIELLKLDLDVVRGDCLDETSKRIYNEQNPMSIDEQARLDLRLRLIDVLGETPAATLMQSVPPLPYDDLAKKTDIDVAVRDLRSETATLSTELRGEMATLSTDLRGEMATLSSELRGEMATLSTDLRGEMLGLKTELRGDMVGLRGDISLELARHLRITVVANFVSILGAVALALQVA